MSLVKDEGEYEGGRERGSGGETSGSAGEGMSRGRGEITEEGGREGRGGRGGRGRGGEEGCAERVEDI